MLTIGALRRAGHEPQTEGPSATVPPPEPHTGKVSTPTDSKRDAANGAVTSGPLDRLEWGAGPAQLGKPEVHEGHENPLRIASDSSGNALLLDPANQRVMRLGTDGAISKAVSLPGTGARDLASFADGSMLILDESGRVTLLDPQGQPRGELPLVGKQLKSPEQVRAVMTQGDEVYAETHRAEYIRLGDARGEADLEQPRMPGQPTSDGSGFVSAMIIDAASGRLHVYVIDRATERQRYSREVVVPFSIEGIYLVGSDRIGAVYIGLTGFEYGASKRGVRRRNLLCFESQRGEMLGRVELASPAAGEAILDATVLPDGAVLTSIWTPEGVRLERQICP